MMLRSITAAALIASAFAFSLAACGGSSSTQSYTQPVYPTGLESQNPTQDLKGVFPSQTREGCCYLSKRNRISVLVPSPARKMALLIEVPAGVYQGRRQGINVQFSGAPAQHRPLNAGRQNVSFDVPAATQGKKASVDLVTDTSFVPAKLGMNKDTTEYTVFLRSVAFAP
jgi:hypothetical protein